MDNLELCLEVYPGYYINILECKLVSHNGNETTEVTLNFTGLMSQLARIFKPELDKESSRIGAKLVIRTI